MFVLAQARGRNDTPFTSVAMIVYHISRSVRDDTRFRCPSVHQEWELRQKVLPEPDCICDPTSSRRSWHLPREPDYPRPNRGVQNHRQDGFAGPAHFRCGKRDEIGRTVHKADSVPIRHDHDGISRQKNPVAISHLCPMQHGTPRKMSTQSHKRDVFQEGIRLPRCPTTIKLETRQ